MLREKAVSRKGVKMRMANKVDNEGDTCVVRFMSFFGAS